MILREVQVVAPVGTSFGQVRGENGVLTIVIKPAGTADWPHGVTPDCGFNTIEEGYTRYVVMDDVETTPPPDEKTEEPECPPSAS